MNDDNGFGVPAGWYPDPLGLPQMRWWDNHGWTEHTTEARAPIVIQEAKLAWADDDSAIDELPTRRERRERERESSEDASTNRSSGDRDGVSAGAANADALLQLEPPSWDELPADEPAPDILSTPAFAPGPPQESQPNLAPGSDAVGFGTPAFGAQGFATPGFGTPGYGTQTAAQPVVDPAAAFAGDPLQQTAAGWTPASAHAAGASSGSAFPLGTAPSTNTLGGWIIALSPLVQLLGVLLVVAAAGSSGTNVAVVLAILIAPYFISIPFAITDQRALRRHGYDRPASWAWVFLSGPVYLIARAIRIVMRAGNGFAPILVWGALVLLQIGSVVAVPGLVISALPQVFSDQAAQSIEQAATVFGPITNVTCPTPPATVMGQEFTCTLDRIGSGQTYKVTAALERQNGWIAWQVQDWGDFNLTSH